MCFGNMFLIILMLLKFKKFINKLMIIEWQNDEIDDGAIFIQINQSLDAAARG